MKITENQWQYIENHWKFIKNQWKTTTPDPPTPSNPFKNDRKCCNLTNMHPKSASGTRNSMSGRGTGFGTGPAVHKRQKCTKMLVLAPSGAITLVMLPWFNSAGEESSGEDNVVARLHLPTFWLVSIWNVVNYSKWRLMVPEPAFCGLGAIREWFWA